MYEYLAKPEVQYNSSNVFIRHNFPWRVCQEEYDYCGEQGGPSYYEYDEENRLVRKIFERSDSLFTISEYSYFPTGALKESVRHYSDGREGVFVYWYDDEERLVFKELTIDGKFASLEKYIYDNRGKLISAKYDNVDNWLSGELVFEHDKYDRVIKANFKGENNLEADIFFEYDKYNNLLIISWIFSDGKTQTYFFDYDPVNTNKELS